MSKWIKSKIDKDLIGTETSHTALGTAAANVSAPIEVSDWDNGCLWVHLDGVSTASATSAHVWLQYSFDNVKEHFAELSGFSPLVHNPAAALGVPVTYVIPLTANDMPWMRVLTSGDAASTTASAKAWVVLCRRTDTIS